MTGKSFNEKTTLQVVPLSPETARPDPPNELNKREKELWREIVSAMPPHWFLSSTQPMLRRLVSHSATAERLEECMRNIDWKRFEESDAYVARYNEMQRMYVKATQQVSALSHRLRLTPLARNSPQTAETKKQLRARPWET
jgi:hypothetical protein